MRQVSRITFIFDKRDTSFIKRTLKIICCHTATLGLKGLTRLKVFSMHKDTSTSWVNPSVKRVKIGIPHKRDTFFEAWVKQL